jgi:hypothetical protein
MSASPALLMQVNPSTTVASKIETVRYGVDVGAGNWLEWVHLLLIVQPSRHRPIAKRSRMRSVRPALGRRPEARKIALSGLLKEGVRERPEVATPRRLLTSCQFWN